MSSKTIREFKIDTKELSQKEKIIFRKLISAAKLIAPLYLKQKNNKYPGANFYPHNVAREEIEKANEINPAILDPYTFVERDKTGKLIATPFHIRFQKELKPVAKLLNEAAKLSENKNFAWYLKERAKSLLNGDYERSEIVWLKTETFKIGFVIGPIERYLDKLFFKKCAYQAWLGILDEEKTKEAERLKRIILTGRRKILPESEKVDIRKMGVRVDKIAIFAGLIADFMFTGTNLPNDVNLMKKYGSNFTIFETSLELKFNQDHFPIFQKIFPRAFQNIYSRELLYNASLNCILSHEISHSLMRYRDAETRLKDLFPVFDEAFAYVLGVKSFGHLILKGVISQKDLEAILIMYICRNFTWYLDFIKNPNVSHYTTGAAIAYNFFLKEKVIKIKQNRQVYLTDFTRLFICIDELSHLLEYYLALGTYQEAKEFIKEWGSFKTLERITKSLKQI